MPELAYTNQITGWMALEELDWLYHAAQKMSSIVEVGSWCGRSTHALLSGCPGPVYAIDHFKGSASEPTMLEKARKMDVYATFTKNVGHFPNLVVLRGDSKVMAAQAPTVDMVFLDGAHTYESVLADLRLYGPKATKLLCGHDYTNPNQPGVRRAVDQMYGKQVQKIHSLWLVLI